MPRLLLFLLPALVFAQTSVRYEFRFPNAVHHEAQVRVTFSGVRTPVLEAVMSRSSPGRYSLHEFAKNVYSVRATDSRGKELPIVRPNPHQWSVSGHDGTVTVEYTLFGDRADGTYDGIDATHAHLNMPATLMWAHGFDKVPIEFHFAMPEGSNWRVSTQLVEKDAATFTAPNLDWAMDSPVEISANTIKEWDAGGAHFRLALHHSGTDAEAAAYARLCEAVVREEEGVFGEFPKYDHGSYTFLIDYLRYVSGDGMEHRDSTVITGTRPLKDAYSFSIGTVAHEFFHSWNVERIRPRSIEPFNFEHENLSGELWFAEGFTSYYGPLALMRAGVTGIDRFSRSLAGAVNGVLNSPGRNYYSVVGMSQLAAFADGAAANDPRNLANTFISYYTYGDALALGIDLAIRSQFPGKSLDDWMRAMWATHGKSEKPYTLDDLERALASVTNQRFASDIFTAHIRGKQPMDYETLLAKAGFLLRKRSPGRAWLGRESLSAGENGLELTGGTLVGSPLYGAGLDRGDRITKIDGRVVRKQEDLDAWLRAKEPGEEVSAVVETRAGTKEVTIRLAESPDLEVVPFEQAGRLLNAEQREFRDSWLRSHALAPLPKLEKFCGQCKRALPFEYENCPYDGSLLQLTPDSGPPAAGPPQRRRR